MLLPISSVIVGRISGSGIEKDSNMPTFPKDQDKDVTGKDTCHGRSWGWSLKEANRVCYRGFYTGYTGDPYCACARGQRSGDIFEY